MASVLPLQEPVDHTPRDRTEVVVADDSTAVLQKLSSDTAQEILAALSEGPVTTSEIADTVDTSLQNAQYHLRRLVETDLIEAVDTWYSVRGNEMTVYALAADELVVRFSATRTQRS